MRYQLAEDDIYQLTKRTPYRDWMATMDPRPFEEYKAWWESIYGEFMGCKRGSK
jgi:hypothetical protein